MPKLTDWLNKIGTRDLRPRVLGRLSHCVARQSNRTARQVSLVCSRLHCVTMGLLLSLMLGISAAGVADGADLADGPVDPHKPIIVEARNASHWNEGNHEVWWLRGDCRIRQGGIELSSEQAILWVDQTDNRSLKAGRVVAYMEGNVVKRRSGGPQISQAEISSKLHRFRSNVPFQFPDARTTASLETKPAIWERAKAASTANAPSVIQRTQFVAPYGAGIDIIPGTATRRVRISPRGSAADQVEARFDKARNEWVGTIDGGVNIVIEGLGTVDMGGTPMDVGTISIDADRAVFWTSDAGGVSLSGTSDLEEGQSFEIYMEGNILFVQGEKNIRAQSMYFNATGEYGQIVKAELLTPAPEFQGMLRLKADVLEILDQYNYRAHGAAFTSSRMGYPRYWYQSAQLDFQDISHPRIDPFTGRQEIDLQGEPVVDHTRRAVSKHNFMFLTGVPIFYWPVMAIDMTDPTLYLHNLQYKNDEVFGTQIYTGWDLFEIFGFEEPPTGTEWELMLDQLSDRGMGVGTQLKYKRHDLLGFPGFYEGKLDAWGISDRGFDNLGRGRWRVAPEEDTRYRIRWQHRQFLSDGYEIAAEFGWISDRNFLENYYEYEWDTYKDQSTGIQLQQRVDNASWSLAFDAQVNSFFTQTSWLPRLDHYRLGESILFDRLTWYEHTNVGYAKMQAANAPINAQDSARFDPLPWEADVGGARVATRQEIDLPIPVGPAKVTPYVLGELAHWEEDLNGDSLSRAYGQLGLRASLPMWSSDPAVRSTLWNVHGLAHKVTFEADMSISDATRDLDSLPLYDPLDDDSTELFRRRMLFNTFGRTFGEDVPRRFDERFYALRSGMQGNVAAASTEIAGDLSLARLGVHQRWQTKRGMPGHERIVDWITLDLDTTLFPDADRDNFGETLGMAEFKASWAIGERVTLHSDGYFDFFEDGLQTISVGAFFSRPSSANLYIGYRAAEGPFSSKVLTGMVHYRMSEKWIARVGGSYDFGEAGTLGHRVSLTRVGESFLVEAGFRLDVSRENFGLVVTIEPRFLPFSPKSSIGGGPIAPVGSLGIE